MSGEAWLYLLAVLINAVNLFLQVFFTIMYSDLEWSVLLQPRVSGLELVFGDELGTIACTLLRLGRVCWERNANGRIIVTTSTLSTSATASTPILSPKQLFMVS